MVLLPWERLLWSGQPVWSAGVRYTLTDFRLVVGIAHRPGKPREPGSPGNIDEILLDDIADVELSTSTLDRLLGTATLTIHARGSRRAPLRLAGVRRGAQMASLLALLTGDPRPSLDEQAVRTALAWSPSASRLGALRLAAGLGAAVVVVFAVAISLRGESGTVVFPLDDAIYPAGVKRARADIVRFMEADVMPWARVALAPLVGGPERVTCATCHGQDPEGRQWQMPGVSALPEPHFKLLGWETYSAGMDAQMRNAIYGYLAESDNQARATYMRDVIMPGMARLLHRPAYDFTKSYAHNRSRLAFGCYHCHRVG